MRPLIFVVFVLYHGKISHVSADWEPLCHWDDHNCIAETLFDIFEEDDADRMRLMLQSGLVSTPDYRPKACCSYTHPTLLICAACKGAFNVTQLLLKDFDADTDLRCKDGGTPLIWAARAGYDDIVALLLKFGSNVNERTKRYGDTALTMAAFNGHSTTVRILVESGADLNIKQNAGKTALKLAQEEGYDDIATYLQLYSKLKSSITRTRDL